MTDNWNTVGKTPHDKAQSYRTTNNESEPEFGQDFASLYEDGLRVLESHGFLLERSPQGTHCGHVVYMRTKPREIPGIEYPSWFKILQLIDTIEAEAQLAGALLGSPSATKEMQQFWSPLTMPLSGQRSTPLQGYVERLHRIDQNSREQNDSLPFELGIQVSNFTPTVAKTHKSPRAHLPPREWFAPQVQQLRFEDIFTLWPQAELQMLKLILGRAWLGRSNSKLVGEERILEHTFRSVGIIVGEDAGMGKSTIFNKLARATNAVGYRWANFRNVGEQFGIGDVVSADVAYKDDVTGDTLAALIRSENTKIIASGGRILVEDKFQKATTTYSKCVLLANTNEWNPRLAYSLDPGTVDRIKLLTTYRRNELDREARAAASGVAKGSPSYAPFIHIPWLANELGVSEECLLLWASRLAVDEFMGLTNWKGEVPTEALRLAIHNVSSRLRYSFNKDCTRAIINGMLLSHIMLTHLTDVWTGTDRYALKELNPTILRDVFTNFRCLVTDAETYRLKELIKLHWELSNRPEIHPWSGIRKLNFLSIKDADVALSNALTTRLPLDKMVKEVFGKLSLRDGFVGSSDIVWVTAAWQASSGYLEDIEQLGRTLTTIIKREREGDFAAVAATMGKISKGVADAGWLETPQYTPSGVSELLSKHDNGFDVNLYRDELEKIKWAI